MNSALNLNATWTVGNSLNYIEHSFSGSIIDCYDSLNEEGKNVLRMIEIPAAMSKNLCMKIETEFIGF